MRKMVEFLLARCDTHPEEFYEERKSGVKHNWLHYFKTCKKFMTEEEHAAIWEKVSQINLDYTMERITEKLFEPEDEEFTQESLVEAIKNGYVTQGHSIPNEIVRSKVQINLLKAQIEKQRDEMKHQLDTYRYSMEGRYESDKDNG